MRFSVREIWNALLQPLAVTLFAEERMPPPPEADDGQLLSRASEDEEILKLASHGFRTPGVAHDLGNMLQVIGSSVRLLDRSLDEGSRRRVQPFTRSALAAIERAGALTRKLLDAQKTGAPHYASICPNETLRTIQDLVLPAIGSEIELHTQCNEDVPKIRCDLGELENAILNLVMNARDAMPQGGKLILSTHAEWDARNSRRDPPSAAVICICDNGAGIPAEITDKVFTPFYSTKAPGRGTGLGLSMVDAFARRYGGTAELYSTVGLGTTVILRLPACHGSRLEP